MSKRLREATTLVELLVVMGLMGLVVTMVYFVIQAGLAFYLDSTSALEIRQEALFGLNRLSVELREASKSTLRVDMVSATKGLVFASPRDSQGKTLATSDGKFQWQRFICYYLGPNLSSQALFRKEEALATLSVRAPDPLGATPPRDPAYFLALASNPKMVARQVQSLVVTPSVDSVQISLSCQVSTRHTHLIELRTRVVPNLL